MAVYDILIPFPALIFEHRPNNLVPVRLSFGQGLGEPPRLLHQDLHREDRSMEALPSVYHAPVIDAADDLLMDRVLGRQEKLVRYGRAC